MLYTETDLETTFLETVATRPIPNWTAIELLYTKTDESIRAIANLHGVSHTAIQKRAAKRRWVKYRLPEAETAPVPLPEYREGIVSSAPSPREPLPQPRLDVEARDGAAMLEAVKQSGPQPIVERARGLVEALLWELDAAIAHKDIRSPSRALQVKSLAGAAKQLIDGAIGKPMGKKEEQEARAKEAASSGRFRQRSRPPAWNSPSDENR